MVTSPTYSSTLLSLLSCAMLLLAPPLQAAEPPSRTDGIATVRLSAMSGFPDLFGVSLSVTSIRPFELEVGASSLILGNSQYLRGGVAYLLLDRRGTTARGWTLETPFLIGGRRLRTIPFDSSVSFYGVTADLGLEAIYWVVPHFGLDVQLLAGGIYWMTSTTSTPISDNRVVPDFRLAIGAAF